MFLAAKFINLRIYKSAWQLEMCKITQDEEFLSFHSQQLPSLIFFYFNESNFFFSVTMCFCSRIW